VAQLAESAATAAVAAGAQPEADLALVRRAAGGDRGAFARLIDRHYGFIHRVAAKWIGSAADAEDIAQDVCVKLAGTVGSFDGRCSFSTWLYRIVLNVVRDRQRQRTRERRRDRAFLDVHCLVEAPGQEDAATLGELWRAVAALPERQRDAVMLVYAEDLSHLEAAEILDVSENTVSWYVHQARKTLRGLL